MELQGQTVVAAPTTVIRRVANKPVAVAVEVEEEFIEGATVRHPTYGRGVIERIEDEFGIHKATVEFRDFGKRKVNCSQLESQEVSYDFDV